MSTNDEYNKIKNNLIGLGYTHTPGNNNSDFEPEDMFTKTTTRVNQMIVNGQPIQQEIKTEVILSHYSTGWVEDEDGSNHDDLYFFDIKVNDQPFGTFGVSCWDDMVSMIKL